MRESYFYFDSLNLTRLTCNRINPKIPRPILRGRASHFSSDVTEGKGGKKAIEEEGKQYGGNGGKDYGKRPTILHDYRPNIVKDLEPNNIIFNNYSTSVRWMWIWL